MTDRYENADNHYFSLCVRNPDSNEPWHIVFGDHEWSQVATEAEDYLYDDQSVYIMETVSDQQRWIDYALRKLNMNFFTKIQEAK